MLKQYEAVFTYDSQSGAYYFAPSMREDPPYREQRHVTAILDIAADGTLAGVELVLGELPPPPMPYQPERRSFQKVEKWEAER